MLQNRYYIGIILVLYCYYIGIILVLYCYYIVIILLLYCYYIVIILLLYCYYIVIILLLYCYYIGIILVLYCYYIVIPFGFNVFVVPEQRLMWGLLSAAPTTRASSCNTRDVFDHEKNLIISEVLFIAVSLIHWTARDLSQSLNHSEEWSSEKLYYFYFIFLEIWRLFMK